MASSAAPPPADTPTTQNRWLWPAVAAAAILVIAIVVVLLTRPGDETPVAATTTSTGSTGTASTSPTTTSTGTATTATSPAPSPTTSSSPTSSGETVLVPVYYVSDLAGQGPRLYREFHRAAQQPQGAVETAVTQMLSAKPADPDYSSLWPTTTSVTAVSVDGASATVDLSAFPSLDEASERIAVQQLVYTVTAADTAVSSVRVLVNGAAPSSASGDYSQPVGRATPMGTLSNVWILAPEHGSTVGSPVEVKVYGTGYEGNVPLLVFQGEKQVARTFVTTAQGDFAEASTSIELGRGEYELRAYNDNGRDGTLTLWDSKTFVVN